MVFSNIEEKDRSILMSRVYTFAHAAWVDIDKNNANLESAMRYKQSVMALTQTYINQVNSIDFQYGRKNQTLLLQIDLYQNWMM